MRMTPAPLLDDPKQFLLEMAEQRELPALLQLIVQRHAASPGVALTCIWLTAPGDICTTVRCGWSARTSPNS